MSMMVSFVLSFFPRDVLDEILNLIESVSEDFPSYSSMELLNLAKKTDLLNIADHYALTSVKPSMLKHELKNTLIKFFG